MFNRKIIFAIVVVLFAATTTHAQSAPPVNPDSMSIPFFPLHVGDVKWFRYRQWPDDPLPPYRHYSEEVTGGIPNRDTMIDGKHYISLDEEMRYFDTIRNEFYRTNGRDTVWVWCGGNCYPDSLTHEKLFMTISSLQHGDTIVGREGKVWGSGLGGPLDSITVSPMPYGSGTTRKLYISYGSQE